MKMHGIAQKIAATLIAVGGVLGSPVVARAEEPQVSGWKHGLEGTWLVEVTQKNCATGAEVAPPFTSLLTFATGGTMTETTSAPSFFPAVRGPGHGVWSRTAKGDYQASTVALITMNGVLVKVQTINQKITLGPAGDGFSSSAGIQFASPAGDPIAKGCASALGTRFE